MSTRIVVGDALSALREMPDGSVRCCVTSPPYWGLRDYGVAGQLGLEPTPQEYVAAMVAVFREVRRVLADDGTLWLNLGDSYSSGTRTTQVAPTLRAKGHDEASGKAEYLNGFAVRPGAVEGLAGKQLIGIPWRVAFALQEDGWWLRSDIIWAKPNPMPESVTDRPTKAHEYLFLLSKSARYYYDSDAIAEPSVYKAGEGGNQSFGAAGGKAEIAYGSLVSGKKWDSDGTRNARTVWQIATQPFSGAHFATFPTELPRRCILAGSAPGDTVLDPFSGAGTTLLVADRLGRNGLGVELNPKYAEMARRRITADAPLFHEG